MTNNLRILTFLQFKAVSGAVALQKQLPDAEENGYFFIYI